VGGDLVGYKSIFDQVFISEDYFSHIKNEFIEPGFYLLLKILATITDFDGALSSIIFLSSTLMILSLVNFKIHKRPETLLVFFGLIYFDFFYHFIRQGLAASIFFYLLSKSTSNSSAIVSRFLPILIHAPFILISIATLIPFERCFINLKKIIFWLVILIVLRASIIPIIDQLIQLDIFVLIKDYRVYLESGELGWANLAVTIVPLLIVTMFLYGRRYSLIYAEKRVIILVRLLIIWSIFPLLLYAYAEISRRIMLVSALGFFCLVLSDAPKGCKYFDLRRGLSITYAPVLMIPLLYVAIRYTNPTWLSLTDPFDFKIITSCVDGDREMREHKAHLSSSPSLR
jgi:hypothetical protein